MHSDLQPVSVNIPLCISSTHLVPLILTLSSCPITCIFHLAVERMEAAPVGVHPVGPNLALPSLHPPSSMLCDQHAASCPRWVGAEVPGWLLWHPLPWSPHWSLPGLCLPHGPNALPRPWFVRVLRPCPRETLGRLSLDKESGPSPRLEASPGAPVPCPPLSHLDPSPWVCSTSAHLWLSPQHGTSAHLGHSLPGFMMVVSLLGPGMIHSPRCPHRQESVQQQNLLYFVLKSYKL